MYGRFVDSEKGRFFAYGKRKKRVLELWWSGKLQSKRSATAELSAQFQKELLKAMPSVPTSLRQQ